MEQPQVPQETNKPVYNLNPESCRIIVTDFDQIPMFEGDVSKLPLRDEEKKFPPNKEMGFHLSNGYKKHFATISPQEIYCVGATCVYTADAAETWQESWRKIYPDRLTVMNRIIQNRPDVSSIACCIEMNLGKDDKSSDKESKSTKSSKSKGRNPTYKYPDIRFDGVTIEFDNNHKRMYVTLPGQKRERLSYSNASTQLTFIPSIYKYTDVAIAVRHNMKINGASVQDLAYFDYYHNIVEVEGDTYNDEPIYIYVPLMLMYKVEFKTVQGGPEDDFQLVTVGRWNASHEKYNGTGKIPSPSVPPTMFQPSEAVTNRTTLLKDHMGTTRSTEPVRSSQSTNPPELTEEDLEELEDLKEAPENTTATRLNYAHLHFSIIYANIDGTVLPPESFLQYMDDLFTDCYIGAKRKKGDTRKTDDFDRSLKYVLKNNACRELNLMMGRMLHHKILITILRPIPGITDLFYSMLKFGYPTIVPEIPITIVEYYRNMPIPLMSIKPIATDQNQKAENMLAAVMEQAGDVLFEGRIYKKIPGSRSSYHEWRPKNIQPDRLLHEYLASKSPRGAFSLIAQKENHLIKRMSSTEQVAFPRINISYEWIEYVDFYFHVPTGKMHDELPPGVTPYYYVDNVSKANSNQLPREFLGIVLNSFGDDLPKAVALMSDLYGILFPQEHKARVPYLLGEGNSGKTTLVDIIANVLPMSKIAVLGSGQFALSQLFSAIILRIEEGQGIGDTNKTRNILLSIFERNFCYKHEAKGDNHFLAETEINPVITSNPDLFPDDEDQDVEKYGNLLLVSRSHRDPEIRKKASNRLQVIAMLNRLNKYHMKALPNARPGGKRLALADRGLAILFCSMCYFGDITADHLASLKPHFPTLIIDKPVETPVIPEVTEELKPPAISPIRDEIKKEEIIRPPVESFPRSSFPRMVVDPVVARFTNIPTVYPKCDPPEFYIVDKPEPIASSRLTPDNKIIASAKLPEDKTQSLKFSISGEDIIRQRIESIRRSIERTPISPLPARVSTTELARRSILQNREPIHMLPPRYNPNVVVTPPVEQEKVVNNNLPMEFNPIQRIPLTSYQNKI